MRFLRARLAGYATRRNQPDIDGTSQLSPYLHFGQIGAHTVAMAVKDADGCPRRIAERSWKNSSCVASWRLTLSDTIRATTLSMPASRGPIVTLRMHRAG